MTRSRSWPIRDADADDLEALGDIFRRASLSNEGDRALLLAHPEVLVLTAEDLADGRTRAAIDADRIVGFATVVPGEDALELDALFVDPELMRQGIGSALVDDALAMARELGVDRFEVTGNDHAIAFYLAAGFEVIGVVDTPLGAPGARLRRMV